ncbi:hypothetical protein [Kosakonia cowanii]|uniref:hypothetical protein n=1 Tax=Kosakonia cowanii TaxID=208223 RepID=UPI003EEA02E7
MINKNSLVSIGFSSENQTVLIGKLMKYEFYSPTGNGQITVVVEPINEELDKTLAAKLNEKLGELVAITITNGPVDEVHTVFLSGVETSASNFNGPYVFDRLVITGNKP